MNMSRCVLREKHPPSRARVMPVSAGVRLSMSFEGRYSPSLKMNGSLKRVNNSDRRSGATGTDEGATSLKMTFP